jgi:hypothetical protein
VLGGPDQPFRETNMISPYFTASERAEIEEAQRYVADFLKRHLRKVPETISPELKRRIRAKIAAAGDRAVTTVGGRLL